MKLNTEKLPSSWCVQCDGSERFKEVMRAIDTSIYHPENSPLYSHRRSYYGIHDGVMHFSITKPFGTVLTLDELCELVGWEDRKPWGFCETPEIKCTMNYCDDNGCQNRKRNYVEVRDKNASKSENWQKFGPPIEWISDEEIKSWQANGQGDHFNAGMIAGAEWMRQRMAEEFERRMK